MRTYRVVWGAGVVILTVAAVLAGAATAGWPSLLGVVGAMAVCGAVSGFAWVGDPQRRRAVVVGLGLWCGVGSALVVGTPQLVGLWWPLLVLAVAAVSPVVLTWVAGRVLPGGRTLTPEQVHAMAPRSLEQRWLRTSHAVRDRASGTAAILALVQERELLLDEIERRDPEGFDFLLVRAGWRDPHDV